MVSSFVILVSRVPSVNASSFAPLATPACRNRNSARLYGAIEPEMSHNSTTRLGCTRVFLKRCLTASPPVRIAARMVRRGS